MELYDQGIEKLQDEMDFEHTLDRLREIDIFIRGGLFDEKTKFMIQLDDKKCIVLPSYPEHEYDEEDRVQVLASEAQKNKKGPSNKINPNDIELSLE